MDGKFYPVRKMGNGIQVSASELERMARALENLTRLYPVAPLSMTKNSAGTILSIDLTNIQGDVTFNNPVTFDNDVTFGSVTQTFQPEFNFYGSPSYPSYVYFGPNVFISFYSPLYLNACLILAGPPASVYEPVNPPTVALSSPGDTDGEWNAGDYYCKITFVDATGAEGFVSPESAQFTLTGRLTSGGDGRYPVVSMNNTPPAGTDFWRVYFTPTNGATDSEVGPSPANQGETTIFDIPVGTTSLAFKKQDYGTDPKAPPTAASSTGGSGTQPWSCFLPPTCCGKPTWTGKYGETAIDMCGDADSCSETNPKPPTIYTQMDKPTGTNWQSPNDYTSWPGWDCSKLQATIHRPNSSDGLEWIDTQECP